MALRRSVNGGDMIARTNVPGLRTWLVVMGWSIMLQANLGASEWKMIWSDEFDKPTINTNKWNFEIGGHGWGNEEWEYYTSSTENARIENGMLVIEAKKQAFGGRDYTSARMTTKHKGDWKYGRVNVRAKLPQGKGIWPAIWMMPSDAVYGGWPKSGEIDIMELIGHDPHTIYGSLHYAAPDGKTANTGQKLTTSTTAFPDDFHTYSFEWAPGKQVWLVDDVPFSTKTIAHPFDQRFYLILNVAVGGHWPGYPDETTQFPQKMLVDYVRVYRNASADDENSETTDSRHMRQNSMYR